MTKNYRTYLQSEDWKQKRTQKRAGRRCAICAAETQLDVHHLRYVGDLTTTEQKDLRVLCRRCHDIAHELLRTGVLVYRSPNHHSRFALTKVAVKKALGLTGRNMFNP